MARTTVLLTCYNHVAYLDAAVQSIRAQTDPDLEILALDDGSSDGSREWLASQPDLKCVFHEHNLGTYGSLNRGIELADSQFIAILNDDDRWLPTKLARQVEALSANPSLAMVHTNVQIISDQGSPLPDERAPFGRLGTSEAGALAELVMWNRIVPSTVLIRRSVMEEVGRFDDTFFGCGDWHLWLRMALKGKIAFIDERLTEYRVHDANAYREHVKMNTDSRRIRSWIDQSPDFRTDPKLQNAHAHNLACLGTECKLDGDWGAARAAYLASARANPRRIKSWVRWLASLARV